MTSTEISQFTISILENDLFRNKELRFNNQCKLLNSGLIKNSLPIDSSSSPGTLILDPQLIHNETEDLKEFLKQLHCSTSSENQEAYILCATASSGMGKTHLAYAAGDGQGIISIVIRIVEPVTVHTPMLSAPFQTLENKLRDVLRNQQSSPDEEMSFLNSAENSYSYIKLLIATYVDATLQALQKATDLAVTDQTILQELCLRFNRNYRGESIVNQMFLQNIENVENNGLIERRLVNNYTEGVVERASKYKLLLTFDEAQALIGMYARLFFRKGAFDEMKNPTDTIPAALPSTGLFYAFCCAMCDFNQKYRWAMYITGTAFSMTKFHKTASDFSPLRGSLTIVHPSTVLTVEDIKRILQYYWIIADSVFDDDEVTAALNECKGRPLLFVKTIFLPLYFFVQRSSPQSIDKQVLLDRVQGSVGQVVQIWENRMEELLQSNIRILPTNDSLTSRSYLPVLVKSILFGNGEIDPHSTRVMEEAIIQTGLLPLSALLEGPTRICVRNEPIVWRGLTKAIGNELLGERGGRGLGAIMHLLVANERDGKGKCAESAFAFHVALACYKESLIRSGDSSFRGVRLTDLLEPLFPAEVEDLPEVVGGYYCRATRAVNMSEWDSNVCTLRRFLTDSGTLDDSIVLYNLPEMMGIDGAMLVSSPTDPPTYRLVASQFKNKSRASLSEVLFTLHPGTQYLTNVQREYVLKGKHMSSSKFFHTPAHIGAGSSAWNDYVRFAKEPLGRALCADWIRLAVVGRNVSPNVILFIKSAEYKRDFYSKWLHQNVPKSAIAASIRSSPVIMLSFLSPRFFDPTLRELIVEEGQGELSFSKNVRWPALSVDEMIALVPQRPSETIPSELEEEDLVDQSAGVKLVSEFSVREGN